MNQLKIGKFIAECRKKNNLTQMQLAEKLNINGRVCLEGLLVFGLGGCGFTYILGPIFDNLCNKIKPKIKVIICCILVTAFLVDLAISSIIPNAGKGITDYDDAKSLDETNVEIYN